MGKPNDATPFEAEMEIRFPQHPLGEVVLKNMVESIHPYTRQREKPLVNRTNTSLSVEQGILIGTDRTGDDLTNGKQADDGIYQKYKELELLNAEKDKFLSIVAHDLRSPFNSLLGLTRMMVEELPTLTMDEIRKISETMKSSVNNLYNLLENLLEWSQMQRDLVTFQPKEFLFLNALVPILDSVRDSADRKMIRIGNDFPEDLMIVADEQMFASLMRNLVFNAIKFTPKGGRVNISAKPGQGNSVEISISDTGIGMNKQMINCLFHLDKLPCRRGTDGEPSSGFGLLLCKGYVEKHGGKIWAESEEDKGSKFSFTIGTS